MSEKDILRIEGLSKSYDGKELVLKELSLSVKSGEVVVIIGPSGCGKSTFLRCLNMLEPINQGKIYLEEKEITASQKTVHKVREDIGMVFQSYELFPHKNILDNIILAPIKVQKRDKKEVIKEAEALLERVGLSDKKLAYPRQLSGGQKQRVAIVRSLIMNPKVLLLDEITAALDPEMVREVLQVVLNLAKEGMTMLIVTHEMEFAKAVADRVLFLEAGVIVESAPPKEFFNHPKTKRAQEFLQSFQYEEEIESA